LRGIEYQYYNLNCPRAYPQWPDKNPILKFPETYYYYHQCKQFWWEFLRKYNHTKTYFTMIKFSNVYSNLQHLPPKWLKEWHNTFGINKGALDPVIIRREFIAHVVPLNKF
jgi:hypothetical protein